MKMVMKNLGVCGNRVLLLRLGAPQVEAVAGTEKCASTWKSWGEAAEKGTCHKKFERGAPAASICMPYASVTRSRENDHILAESQNLEHFCCVCFNRGRLKLSWRSPTTKLTGKPNFIFHSTTAPHVVGRKEGLSRTAVTLLRIESPKS